jgi:hypothetical protein
MRVASLVAMNWLTPVIMLVSLTPNHQYEALSRCAETAQTSHGFRIELDAKRFKAGNSNEVDAIGHVLSKFPQDHISVQVYSDSEPIREAEAIRDRLLEKGVSSEQISLSGLSQNESENSQPTSMWIEIQSTS